MVITDEYLEIESKKLLEIIQIQNDVIEAGVDLERSIFLIARHAQTLLAVDGAVVELRENEQMVYRATSGLVDGLIGLRLKLRGSLSGLCVQTGESLICDDSETDDRVDRQACRRVGLRSMLVVPLVYKDRSVGVLKAIAKEPRSFKKENSVLLSLLAEIGSRAILLAEKYGNNELYVASTTDVMTGLKNRSFFYDVLRATFVASLESGSKFAVFILDMDNLKKINDTHGHQAGDTAIVELSRRVKQALRADDVFARLGGDEFGILVPTIQTEGAADSLKSRIIEAVDGVLAFGEIPIPISSSVGFAVFDECAPDIAKLIDTADARMYEHKRFRKMNRE